MIKFEDLLAAVGFSFDVKKDISVLKLYLIDNEYAYLGGKDTYETEIDPSNSHGAVLWAINRLDNYWHDSIIKDIIDVTENAEHKAKLKELSGYYPDVLKYIKDNKLTADYGYSVKMLEAVCNPESIDITWLTEKTDNINEYLIPISWSMYSNLVVKGAKDLNDAIELARKYEDDIHIPAKAEYIDGSFNIDIETDEEAEYAQNYTLRGVLLDVRDKVPSIMTL